MLGEPSVADPCRACCWRLRPVPGSHPLVLGRCWPARSDCTSRRPRRLGGTHDSVRRRTATLFAALEVATDTVVPHATIATATRSF